MAGTAVARHATETKAYWMLGGLYEVLVSGEETGGALTQMRMTVPAGTGSPPHTHPGGETLQVLDGEIEVHLGDEVEVGRPGDVFHFPAGTREFFEAKTRATVVASYFPGGIDGFFAEVAEPAGSRDLPPPSDEPPDFERIARVGAQYGLVVEAPA